MMRKELVVVIFAILIVTLFTTNTTRAVDPNVSVQPVLIQDETMKPLDPPMQSHPTANQYTAPVTNPADAYDNDQITYSLTNITQQPYPNLYSKPAADTHNATTSDDTKAYDLSNSTFAQIAINNQAVEWPQMKQFSVQTFNTTSITTISSIDIHIRYNLTLTVVGKIGYKFRLYVGTTNRALIPDINWTQVDVETTVAHFIAVPEPTDGVWSTADVTAMRVSIETGRNQSTDRGTFRVFEVWARVYRPVVKYFEVRTFSPTGISGYSYLSVNINCSIAIGGCSYKILISVGSANMTVRNWDDVPQINPAVLPLGDRITEPNDGWWNQSDLSNMRIIIETQKIKSFNNGEFKIYEAWVLISPPTVNLYPSSSEVGGTVTAPYPERAYDKNQITYTSISLPTTFGTYFAVKSFNTTTPKEYASLDVQMRYNATTFGGGQYKISVWVGAMSTDLLTPTNVNRTEPITTIWHGVCEPNDAVWSQSDLSILQVRVEKAVDGGTCTFREYETWVTFPKDSLTVRAYVSGILSSKQLYGWTLNLTFNQNVLQIVTVSDGPFLRSVGFTNFMPPTLGNGWAFATSALDDIESPGAYGSGALATFTFKAISKGNSMFNLTQETALRTVVEGMPKGILHTRSPGWFQYLAGDVNGDAIVSVTDLYQLGKAYGTSSGNPSYDADADQDKDGDVDGADLTTVSDHYGDT